MDSVMPTVFCWTALEQKELRQKSLSLIEAQIAGPIVDSKVCCTRPSASPRMKSLAFVDFVGWLAKTLGSGAKPLQAKDIWFASSTIWLPIQ